MAAVRRALFLRNKFTGSLNALNVSFNNRFSFEERSLLKRFGTGLCITLGGFAVYYQYNSTSQRENKAGRLRALISPLPAVLAKEKVCVSFSLQQCDNVTQHREHKILLLLSVCLRFSSGGVDVPTQALSTSAVLNSVRLHLHSCDVPWYSL